MDSCGCELDEALTLYSHSPGEIPAEVPDPQIPLSHKNKHKYSVACDASTLLDGNKKNKGKFWENINWGMQAERIVWSEEN